jgi:hypothetical protein
MRRPIGRLGVDPIGLVSEESLFSFLEDLTSIRPHLGWRNSASRGEAEAIAYVEETLRGMSFLVDSGLELEKQEFHTYHGTQFWQTRLDLRVAGIDIEVPADGHPGHRSVLPNAMLVDSDGVLNDSDSDPWVTEGVPLVVRTRDELLALSANDVAGRIVFADYALFDRYVQAPADAGANAGELLARSPAGVVLVNTFSNTQGESHGTVANDLSIFIYFDEYLPPILNVRLEDLHVAGISSWEDLDLVESARMTLDVDVFSPGDTANLMARIPGQDSSRAIILSGHIDSPNNPGALDDGSGSVTLLEVARVLNRARVRPPVDVHLVWYGSHERGLFGSSHFVATHQELLDRALAVFQVDCLSVPLDGLTLDLHLEGWSFGIFGDWTLPWPEHVSQVAADIGVSTVVLDYHGLVSDNSSYGGYNVPNFNLIYMDPFEGTEVHYDGHLHDPYDTAELARLEADTLVDMARIAVATVLSMDAGSIDLRVTPDPVARAVFVASHTESVHMAPTHLTELGMALAWEGLDVDVVPYGSEVTGADLDSAAVVVVLPVHDYPSPDGDVTVYDEAWSEPELDVLQTYVEEGGFLVVTNSKHRLKYMNYAYEENEDWPDVNALSSRFGVEYVAGDLPGTVVFAQGSGPLLEDVFLLQMVGGNGVPFTMTTGEVLAHISGDPTVALIGQGAGEVLVLADLGILGNDGGDPTNLPFWRNLATYALQR